MVDNPNPEEFKEYTPPDEELVIPSRLAVVEQVYHQLEGGQPVAIESRFSRILETDEQLYVRKFTATEEWLPLETGWLRECGMLILKNNEGQYTHIPTSEEKEEMEKRVILLGQAGMYQGEEYTTPLAFLPVNETLRFEPYNLELLRVKCLHSSAKYTLTLIPK